MKKLVETVLQEAAVTDAVMNSCFEEMDADQSGTIEWCVTSSTHILLSFYLPSVLLHIVISIVTCFFPRFPRAHTLGCARVCLCACENCRDEFANFFDLAQSSV